VCGVLFRVATLTLVRTASLTLRSLWADAKRVKFYEKTPMVVAQEKNLTWHAPRESRSRSMVNEKKYEGLSFRGKRMYVYQPSKHT
jgi:hypothetical protein